MDKRLVWVVDDDASARAYLSEFLSSRGYRTLCMSSGEHVVRRISAFDRQDKLGTNPAEPYCGSSQPNLLLLDLLMPGIGGLQVLADLEKQGRRVPSIVLSGVDQVSTVVQAMKLGACDYLVKPLDEKELEAAIDRVFDEYCDATDAGPNARCAFDTVNKRMAQLRGVCDRVAQTDVPILITGESGVGKEVMARYIHEKSGRAPFVKVNCAALPADLLESELFGHERGAFTGAQHEKPGKFELAGCGTIMLDEIGEMSPLLQAKLLHILQDGEYTRLGGTHTLRSEARIIAATNKDLKQLIMERQFREDLFFRLNVITLEIPPLRERPEEIVPLCNYFAEKYRAKYKSSIRELPPELLEGFARYHWPGNIRELENHVKRFLLLPNVRQTLLDLERAAMRGDVLQCAPAPTPLASVSLKERAAIAAENAEKELILRTLNEVNWNRKQAAKRLDICYKSLLNKLHRWQLGSQEFSERPQA